MITLSSVETLLKKCTRGRVSFYELILLMLCCLITYSCLNGGYEGEWYPLSAMIDNPETRPIFGHRLLFSKLAHYLSELRPSLDARRAFMLSQIPAIIMLQIASFLWIGLFVRRRYQIFGPITSTWLLSSTFSYWTFYDIGIVAFYSLMLWALKRGSLILSCVLFGVGIINHENILLIAPLSLVLPTVSLRKRLLLFISQLTLYVSIRMTLQAVIPLGAPFQWNLPWNISLLSHPEGPMLMAVGHWLLWSMIPALSWNQLDDFCKRAFLIVCGGLWFVTFLFGHFVEIRQMVALIPLVSASMAACLLSPKIDNCESERE
jgi:hypothetical protein